jgi:hypothetical protein
MKLEISPSEQGDEAPAEQEPEAQDDEQPWSCISSYFNF